MKYSENAICILTALEYKGIGPAWINKKHKPNNPYSIFEHLSQKDNKIEYDDFHRKMDLIGNVLENNYDSDGVVALGDREFPTIPTCINDGEKPVVLFYKGDISLISCHDHNVAVIGVLNPTNEIEQREKKFVARLVEGGCAIVSGLAKGCDSISHKQAIESGGTTIAILPSTLSNIIPSENRDLANKIVDNGGLLVTEYYKEASSKKELVDRFIKRDRLQAMFSKAVCLTASYAPNSEGNDSGSRHAMEKAKEYDIARYIMYNKETDSAEPQFDLSRQLLKDPDVKIITSRTISEIIFEKQTSNMELF